MKIDIHTHTRKIKRGDASTREISPEDFCRLVGSTDVKIIAITNHNFFDKRQYDEIDTKIDEGIQVWPGVELDIIENGKRGHLLVIVSPDKVADFSTAVQNITKSTTPDTFGISIEETINTFDNFEPLYIAHYHTKKPDLSEEDLNKIIRLTKNKNRVIKEVSNAISAGIFIEHGHRSIYGSDVHDWSDYIEMSKSLPELRLPVEGFEQFCLLLDKDPQTVNTILGKKTPEGITLSPFEDETKIEFTFYNDINVFFGSKGTGKTKILEALEKHFSQKGLTAKVFTSDKGKLEDRYDLKGAKLQANVVLNEHSIEFCSSEIKKLREATDEDVTSLTNYIQFFSNNITNKRANSLVITEYDRLDESEVNRSFGLYYDSLKKLNDLHQFIREDKPIKKVSSTEELNKLDSDIQILSKKLRKETYSLFVLSKQNKLFNSAVSKIKNETAKKSGKVPKPSGTGFFKYARKRIEIEASAKKILFNLEKTIKENDKYVGFLGEEKGKLYCRTEIIFHTGSVKNSSFTTIEKINKTPLLDFATKIKEIKNSTLKPDLFEHVAKLNRIDQIDEITALHKLLMFRRFFVINGREYTPSAGECSMLLLHDELESEKDVYLLDEPEKSLGNDYISDVIVPLINEKAKRGKRVFISTHDANIAVRTLPYKSIYRTHDTDGYKTYVGNPFSNNLVNITCEEDQRDWKEVSMKTLEGGKEAFGERGKIYGSI